ncbi:hypothetical protein GCM10027512_24660 [Chromohalobacter beijerinckii]
MPLNGAAIAIIGNSNAPSVIATRHRQVTVAHRPVRFFLINALAPVVTPAPAQNTLPSDWSSRPSGVYYETISTA